MTRMLALADTQPSARIVLGIVGAPGAGKSTLAEGLARAAADRGRGDEVAVLPMDGFHLADAALTRLGRLDRKGAIDTFDGQGVLAMLRRVVVERDHTVYAPAFERTLEQPIAGSIPIDPGVRVVIVEGNYLLDLQEPWRGIRPHLTEAWFVETPDDVRVPRLIARHERFGKSPADARAWVARVDEANARRIAGSRERVDLVVPLGG
ncbi:nucleoside/nucleotide kinase family protein [Humibacter antri]